MFCWDVFIQNGLLRLTGAVWKSSSNLPSWHFNSDIHCGKLGHKCINTCHWEENPLCDGDQKRVILRRMIQIGLLFISIKVCRCCSNEKAYFAEYMSWRCSNPKAFLTYKTKESFDASFTLRKSQTNRLCPEAWQRWYLLKQMPNPLCSLLPSRENILPLPPGCYTSAQKQPNCLVFCKSFGLH